jgi:hypothetical protein
MNEETLFEAAIGKASAAQRAAFLDEVCRDKPELRARLEVLLEGHFAGAGFLEAWKAMFYQFVVGGRR